MSLVEGIGDEVLISFIIGFLLIVFLFGWATDFFRNFSFLYPSFGDDTHNETDLADEIYRSTANRPPSFSNNSVRETVEEVQEELESESSTPEPNLRANDPVSNASQVDKPNAENDNSQNPTTELENEENETIEPDSDDPESLRLKRLEFFTKNSNSAESGPSSSNSDSTRKRKPEISRPQGNGHVPSPNNESSDIPVNSREQAQGYFNIRLKSLDDTERLVRGKSDQQIGAFKREYFSAEVASHKTVRLIYNGQVLQDQRTLGEYNIQEGTVVHVQISNINFNVPQNETQSDSELDLGQFFWPLLGILLGVVWMLYFQYKEYFNASSTIALLGLSGLFLTIVWGQYARPTEHG